MSTLATVPRSPGVSSRSIGPADRGLSWILAHREIVREVVLLGELFDVSTYRPHVRPAVDGRQSSPRTPSSSVRLIRSRPLVRTLPGQGSSAARQSRRSLTRLDIDALNRSLGGNQISREASGSRSSGSGWGWSACNWCLGELGAFVKVLSAPSRRGTVTASISWERLDMKARHACGHETDAERIQQLVDAGWDQPHGDRPPGTKWPTRGPAAPTRCRAPARLHRLRSFGAVQRTSVGTSTRAVPAAFARVSSRSGCERPRGRSTSGEHVIQT